MVGDQEDLYRSRGRVEEADLLARLGHWDVQLLSLKAIGFFHLLAKSSHLLVTPHTASSKKTLYSLFIPSCGRDQYFKIWVKLEEVSNGCNERRH